MYNFNGYVVSLGVLKFSCEMGTMHGNPPAIYVIRIVVILKAEHTTEDEIYKDGIC